KFLKIASDFRRIFSENLKRFIAFCKSNNNRIQVMKIMSTNIAEPTRINWRGRSVWTGIYKKPVTHPLFLGMEGVQSDAVVDTKHHGGIYMACYLFGSDYYDDWKEKYPHLEWNWGMFGENLTVSGLRETEIEMGTTYSVGTAVVQITEPRQPCYKLGIRFGSQQVIPEFLKYGHPGTYLKIVEEGHVTVGDTFQLLEKANNSLTVAQFNTLVNQKEKDRDLLQLAIENDGVKPKNKKKWMKYV
ncbi:MAG: MOSC domain-containing protein, partial [Bacteroidota bacterium]